MFAGDLKSGKSATEEKYLQRLTAMTLYDEKDDDLTSLNDLHLSEENDDLTSLNDLKLSEENDNVKSLDDNYVNSSEEKDLKNLNEEEKYDLKYLTDIKLNEEKEVVWMTAYDSALNTIVISYRGSYTRRNWAQNAMTGLQSVWPNSPIRIHSGWLLGARRTLPKLQNDLQTLLSKYPSASLLFAGHSSAAAYTSIAAFLLKSPFGFLVSFPSSRINIVTIGSPRIGNIAYARAFDLMEWNSSYRVVKGGDAATYWPPFYLPFYYKHQMKEVYINSNSIEQIPVFCDEQGFSLVKGSCTNRNWFVELVANPLRMAGQHLVYFGMELGSSNCKLRIND